MLRFIAYLLSLALALPSFAQATKKTNGFEKIAEAYKKSIIEADVERIREQYQKLKSWKDLEALAPLDRLTEEDKKFVLAKLALVEGTPFVAPKLITSATGWTLEQGKHKVTIDLEKKTLTKGSEVFFYGDKTVVQLFTWLEGAKKTTGLFTDLFISEAHAVAPVVALIIAAGVLALGAMAVIGFVSSFICNENYRKVGRFLAGELNDCEHGDDMSNLVREHHLVSAVKMIKPEEYDYEGGCEESVQNIFSYLKGYKTASCLSEVESRRLCGTSLALAKCLDNPRAWKAISNKERAAIKDFGASEVEAEQKGSRGSGQ